MPSNHILVNNSKEYIIPDSKMGDLLRWLDRNGNTKGMAGRVYSINHGRFARAIDAILNHANKG